MTTTNVPEHRGQADSSGTTKDLDVVICGGGLAGLTLALQLRQELPNLSVAVVERTTRPLPEACHKVGESSVELGSQYLERLGLRDYLLDHHIVKFGLRFFPGGGHLPIDQRTELGPFQEPPVRSYQLDRGRLENDLRAMLEQDGVELIEGARVREVELGRKGDLHRLSLEPFREGANEPLPVALSARWLIDATGRTALLRKKLKLRRGTGHAAHAGWFRVKGRLDITQFVPEGPQTQEWHRQEHADIRWRSTNHFMGAGYWVWLIPLSSGHTSVGIVTHEDRFDFNEVRSLERCMTFLKRHEPYLAAILEKEEILDFKCLSNYSHNAARCWSEDRWALVGEAGAFVDPLYSPGTDFIAFANAFTTELIRVDDAGGNLAQRVRELSVQYRALVSGSLGVYRDASPVYGHARAMAAKIYWDNFAYWSFPCQFFLQGMYRLTGEQYLEVTGLGSRFVELSSFVQTVLRRWALLVDEEPRAGFLGLPHFPSLNVEAHVDLQRQMSPEETIEYMKRRLLQSEEMAAELILRVLAQLSLNTASELLQGIDVSSWNLPFASERLAMENLTGMERRRALPPIARDVERNLGPLKKHAEWPEALALLPWGEVRIPAPPPRDSSEILEVLARA